MNASVEGAQRLLQGFGFDNERTNERSAMTLLALLGLRRGESWAAAQAPLLGTRAIMDWIRDAYGVNYAANSRETIRRFTLHQFAEVLLVVQNIDRPDRPVNSPKWNYSIDAAALNVVHAFDAPEYEATLRDYLAVRPGLKETYAAAREMERIPVTLPGGNPVSLSPGGQNVLIKAMVDDFCSYYTPGGIVLYLGDADSKWAHFDRQTMADLGVDVDSHGKMPDLVVYLPDKDWLVLMEAASSHGPVDAKRYGELASLFSDAKPGLVYVSCFPDRAEMRKYLAAIAWETEIWCADNPTHLIHFNGARFLGPY